MNTKIVELNEDTITEFNVEEFIFKMIKESYNLEYTPQYHYDVIDLYKYYIEPLKNNFYLAIKDDKLVGTAGIRGYDKNYYIKNRTYNEDNTASLYRLFVHPSSRHQKIATNMLKKIEEFCKNKNYNEIYLHTQKDSYGALAFWLNQEYKIVYDTKDEMGTIHMEKILKK